MDVRSLVCLLDPSRLEEVIRREAVQDQVEAADVLLASRPDRATAEQLRAFDEWAGALFPPKRLVGHVENGRMSVELLDLISGRSRPVSRAGHPHGTDHAHAHRVEAPEPEVLCDVSQPIVERSHRSPVASTVGWICWEGLVFDAERVSCWLSKLSQLPGARRAKAVLRTNEGWWGFNFADGLEEVKPSGYRRDSRLEVVIENGQFPDTALLERSLRECLTSNATPVANTT